MKGVLAVGALASSALFGPRTAGFFSGAMAVSLLATVNVMCMVGPRVYYAMAQNRAFFPIAARLHPRWKSPYWAVLAQGACCCLLIVTGTFETLVNYIGFTLNLFAAFSVVALLKFRRRPGWKRLWWVSFAYPLIPGLFVATNLWVFGYFAFLQRWVALWSLLTIVGGALVFQLYRSRETPRAAKHER
jgi:APA family basic amino acid/polyamine antiporter